jgi:hypothetical protein
VRWLLLLTLLACPSIEEVIDEPETPSLTLADPADFDAGDAAWVQQAVPLMWGRRAAGAAEVAVLTDFVEQRGRDGVIRAMANSPEYVDRWTEWLYDTLLIDRISHDSKPLCFDFAEGFELQPDLAIHVRDTPPDGAPWSEPFSMRDLAQSALVLDDLSPLYRATLFARLGQHFFAPVDINRLAYRQDRVEAFLSSYLHRRPVCMRCHNSAWSETDSNDPNSDRTWQIEGLWERALWGVDEGGELDGMQVWFRRSGVESFPGCAASEAPGCGNCDCMALACEKDPSCCDDSWHEGCAETCRGLIDCPTSTDTLTPWGMTEGCPVYVARGAIDPDIEAQDGMFLESADSLSSVWDLEEWLSAGFEGLRGARPVVADDGTVAPEEAFAWLAGLNLADRAWKEAFGARLTLSHHFPRSEPQRDRLEELATRWTDGGFSLVEILVGITSDPMFNVAAPADLPDDHNPYLLPRVVDPWSNASLDPVERGNSVGDRVHAHDPRVLLGSVAFALNWQRLPSFPSGLWETLTLRRLGAQLEVSEPGFRGNDLQTLLGWEHTVGRCETRDGEMSTMGGPDWIDQLLDEGANDPDATVEDVLVALKDRLIAQPRIVDGERALFEAVVGASLDASADQAPEDGIRLACGVWLATPQFRLVGVPADDPGRDFPRLVPPNSDFVHHCNVLSGMLFATGATCDGRAVLDG